MLRSIKVCAIFFSITSLDLVEGSAAAQGTLRREERSAVYVEPITLTEVSGLSGLNLNIGAVVSNREEARGLQRAADIYGIKLDVFVSDAHDTRLNMVRLLIEQGESYIIVDELPGENWQGVRE